MFKAWNTDNPKHDPHNDSTNTKHGKLCGCVALVQGAIGWGLLLLRMWRRGGQTMQVQNSENLIWVRKEGNFVYTHFCNSFLCSIKSWMMFFLSCSSLTRLSMWFCSCLISVRAISMSLPINSHYNLDQGIFWSIYIQKVLWTKHSLANSESYCGKLLFHVDFHVDSKCQ